MTCIVGDDARLLMSVQARDREHGYSGMGGQPDQALHATCMQSLHEIGKLQQFTMLVRSE